MAIATIERDPARETGTPDLRFRLLQQVCGSTEATFWRAIDRRSGKPCLVRIIEADREQSSRRLGELHRERTLAERIGHPGAMRAEVPLIEADRIFQVVDPEPARAVELDSEGGRLAVLNLLVAVAAVLAEAHARGVFHGAFSRASCLRGVDGRALVQGFMGDAASAAAIRDGAAADHRAFLEFATEMLGQTGGPPPRLRRYFTQHLSDAAPKSSATAMSELCADLRESLEDTFPWPLAGPATDTAARAGATVAPSAAVVPAAASLAPAFAAAPVASSEAGPEESPTLTLPALRADAGMALAAPAAPLALVPPIAREPQGAPASATESDPSGAPPATAAVKPAARVTSIAGGTARSRRAKGRSTARTLEAREPPEAGATLADLPVLQQLTASPVSPSYPASPAARVSGRPGREDDSSGRTWRPWLVALVALVAVAAALKFASKSQASATPPAAAAAPSGPSSVSGAPQADPPSAAAQSDASALEGSATVVTAARLPAASPSPRAAVSAAPVAALHSSRDREAMAAPMPKPVAAAPRVAPAVVASSAPAPADAAAPMSPQALRGRVATLVAGGNRALNALEPDAATEAFAAALALSPDDRAAREGSQRARRLEGVEALMRDAREASARSDHGRAVQGYSQALANDPRNRGLAEALAAARRNLGRDATSTLLAEGHAALGAGRFEDARAAFEKALEADPLAPGARRAAEQAATAILLRDEAEARRTAQSVAGRD